MVVVDAFEHYLVTCLIKFCRVFSSVDVQLAADVFIYYYYYYFNPELVWLNGKPVTGQRLYVNTLP